MEKALLLEFNHDKKEILEISETAKKILQRDHNIGISNPEAIPTIVSAFFQGAVAYLSEHKSKDKRVEIDMLGYMDMGIAYMDNEDDADVSGNFVPTLVAGEIFKRAAKNDEVTENEEDSEE